MRDSKTSSACLCFVLIVLVRGVISLESFDLSANEPYFFSFWVDTLVCTVWFGVSGG